MSDEYSKLFKSYDDKVKLISGNYAELSKLVKKINDRLVSDKDSNEKFVEKMKKFKPIESEIIKFNLGGQTFSTLKSTLTKKINKSIYELCDETDQDSGRDIYYKPNLMEGLINGLVDVKYDDNKAIFIDRNPQYFGYIIDYLRETNSEIDYELPQTNDGYKGLLKEAEYFNVQGLVELIKRESSLTLISKIVAENQIEQLFKICGFTKNDRWILLYRGSRDGFGSDVFHKKCDDHTKTLTIVKSNYDCIFGGYTNQTWNSINSYKNDPGAFLFCLDQKVKYANINPGNAIYCHADNGPFFNNDLIISNYSTANGSCSSNLGQSYQNTATRNYLGGYATFSVSEIEVFYKN